MARQLTKHQRCLERKQARGYGEHCISCSSSACIIKKDDRLIQSEMLSILPGNQSQNPSVSFAVDRPRSSARRFSFQRFTGEHESHVMLVFSLRSHHPPCRDSAWDRCSQIISRSVGCHMDISVWKQSSIERSSLVLRLTSELPGAILKCHGSRTAGEHDVSPIFQLSNSAKNR